MRNSRIIVLGLLLAMALGALILFGGCRAFQPEAVIVNKAPETYIIGSPLEHGGGYYHYHVFWYGSDEDGQVEKFVWALTDTTVQDLDTADDEEDQRFNPALDADHLEIANWTTRTDSIFDFAINQGSDISYDMTLHMVAVDDFGDFDRTPARLHFFSNTLGTPILNFFRVDGNDTIPIAQGVPDTVGFGLPYQVFWQGETPNIRGYSPQALAAVDSIYPYDDGLFGYKWQLVGDLDDEDCNPTLDDCWRPRRFNEASGDSFSIFAPGNSLTFLNNGSASNPFGRYLNSGANSFRVNTIDVAGVEVASFLRNFSFIVNHDPETLLLNGQSDFDHPSDSEIYPYYILLNDPTQTKYPFSSGDRIPDRSYVVFKALARDDPRDVRVDQDYTIGMTGVVDGVRENFTGGTFSFSTGASDLDNDPTWGPGPGGWYADTLGFMVGPSTSYTFRMQAVDEHGRRDGTPPSLSFDVGFPPCVQCIELLPDPAQISAYTPDLECYDGEAGHPCFDGAIDEFYIPGAGNTQDPSRNYLPEGTEVSRVYMAIDRITNRVQFQPDIPDPQVYYSIACHVYEFAILLHGKDDPREAWENPLLRAMSWRYQIDYDCDPFNDIKDAGGFDDLASPTWGHAFNEQGIEIKPQDGLWKLTVQVAVPSDIITAGMDSYLIQLFYVIAGQDQELSQELYSLSMRQMSIGQVRALTMDQARCDLRPVRPSQYHLFRGVRPSTDTISGTWRDCDPTFPNVLTSLDLSRGAMSSELFDFDGDPDDEGEAAFRQFRIILETGGQDYDCTTPVAIPPTK
jgi:hypothetical protein